MVAKETKPQDQFLQLELSGFATQGGHAVPETYGIDEEGISAQEESGRVEIHVPLIRVNLTSELQRRILPLSESNN